MPPDNDAYGTRCSGAAVTVPSRFSSAQLHTSGQSYFRPAIREVGGTSPGDSRIKKSLIWKSKGARFRRPGFEQPTRAETWVSSLPCRFAERSFCLPETVNVSGLSFLRCAGMISSSSIRATSVDHTTFAYGIPRARIRRNRSSHVMTPARYNGLASV